jgi:hypothetical protein
LADSGTSQAVKKEGGHTKGGNGQASTINADGEEMEVDLDAVASGKGKGREKEKEDHMSHLVKHGSTLEMVLDCCLALFIFNKILKQRHAKALAMERGALFTAHVWLSI